MNKAKLFKDNFYKVALFTTIWSIWFIAYAAFIMNGFVFIAIVQTVLSVALLKTYLEVSEELHRQHLMKQAEDAQKHLEGLLGEARQRVELENRTWIN